MKRKKGSIFYNWTEFCCFGEIRTVRGSLRLMIAVTDQFSCQIVYIDKTRAMIKNVETKLDSNADNAVISR